MGLFIMNLAMGHLEIILKQAICLKNVEFTFGSVYSRIRNFCVAFFEI